MIHGRPGGHPLHKKYGQSVGADFQFVDFLLRWHDRNYVLKKYLSWVICALFFPKRKKYDYFLCEGPHFMIGIMKILGLLRKNQKLIVLLDDETLYFLFSKFYSKNTSKAFIYLLKKFDAIICMGDMNTMLAKKVLGNFCPPVYTSYNGINDERLEQLMISQPKLKTKNIIFIGNVLSGWRSLYKGIDLLLQVFDKISKSHPDASLKIVGYTDKEYLNKLINKYVPESINKVELFGHTNDLEIPLSECSLYLHPARGEAWGISVTEAMAAGVIPIVSEWTGSKEVVQKVSENLITSLNIDDITARVNWYFNLEEKKKAELSAKCKSVACFYSETNAINNFKKIFKDIEQAI